MIKQIDFEKTPVVEAVNDILVDASKRGASDIHFDPLEQFMKVRIRVDGQLHDYVEVPNSIKKNLITRIKIISGMNITESRLPQDGAIKATIKDVNLDLRVSSIPTNEGEKIVIRLLDYSMSNSGLEMLGFSDRNLKKVIQMINVPNGIILITGATGSGKSTTVYSILQRLNKEDTNIITVEDPIEMNITGINQIQTNSEIGLDFATALRSILRQDPNIIMIGEIRDTETAKIAVRASITGHLVLSTIHTNDSLNTIERLLDMDVERYLLSSALTGIISQKLARRLCPHCRTKRPTNQYEKEIFMKVLGHEVDEIYSTGSCDECGNGYSGRIAIHEVLLINQDIKDAISDNVAKDKLRQLVYNSDVITLLQDGLEKVENGLTTFEEVLKLIELEDDEKLASTYSLKMALDYTDITKRKSDDNDTKDLSNEIDNNEQSKFEYIEQNNSLSMDALFSDSDSTIEGRSNQNSDNIINQEFKEETTSINQNIASQTQNSDNINNQDFMNETTSMNQNISSETQNSDNINNQDFMNETTNMNQNIVSEVQTDNKPISDESIDITSHTDVNNNTKNEEKSSGFLGINDLLNRINKKQG
ncbi:MAG: Flp pilus assembly complex ATPase component TadA [Bacilli bacterium]|nr:Flp pilus assembly complex ATPase component TadA [Bacilli bacterium]